MLHDSSPLGARRRGVILLVVVSMLTLFAIIGLSFVMYANSEAEGSKLQRQAQVVERPEVEPDLLAAFALSQLIYDVPNDETGLYSAMRGHSLARSMYGWNDTPGDVGTNTPGGVNVVPFNGVGRLNYAHPTTTPPHLFVSQPEQDLINYTFHRNITLPPSYVNAIRDPERLGIRPPNPTTPPAYGPTNGYTGGYNVPYTYPDRNNMFLAAVRADGSVLMPSFFRPWTGFNLPTRLDQGLDPGSWRWLRDFDTNSAQVEPWLRNMVLRPRRADHPNFPLPEDGGGDVKQLIGSPGTLIPGLPVRYWTNDSFWMDLNFPVMTTPEGVKYKPLFALLVTDLDNRVNLNVHGNIKANLSATGDPRYPRRYEHRSHMGFGPWEVNVGRVLPRIIPGGSTRPEWNNLFTGDPGRNSAMDPALGWLGRYGTNLRPTTGDSGPVGRTPHFYGPVDFDAAKRRLLNSAPSDQLGIQDQTAGGTRPDYFAFPWLSAVSGWDNGFTMTGITDPNEQLDHPLLYNVLNPRGDDRQFAISNMEALLRYADTGTSALTSELFQLCPENFQNNPKSRGLVTVRSFDVDRPGVVPWVRDDDPPTGGLTVAVTTRTNADNPPAPKGENFLFPNPLTRTPPFNSSRDNGEFGGADWRALTAALGRIDLNRALAPYPHQGRGQRPPFSNDPLTRGASDPSKIDPHGRFDDAGAIEQQFRWAQEDRRQLANDIYRMLLRVTGVRKVPLAQRVTPSDADLRPRRWLAQLAVNIVDFIDEDEISTPFLFYDAPDAEDGPPFTPAQLIGFANATTQDDADGNGNMRPGEIQFPKFWVFGTELPRLALNEVMVQTWKVALTEPNADRRVRTFVELHNPFPTTVPQTVQQHDALPVPLRIVRGPDSYAPYQIVIAADNGTGPEFRSTIIPGTNNDNVLGCPLDIHVKSATKDTDFDTPLTTTTMRGPAQTPWNSNPRFADIAPPYVPNHNVGNADPKSMFLLAPGAIDPATTDEERALKNRDPFETGNSDTIPQNTPYLQLRRPPTDPQALEHSSEFVMAAENDERTNGVAVLLRRLVNPHLPFDGRRIVNPGTGDQINPRYNPYVTIDYLDHIPLSETQDGGITPITSRGKLQPFAAYRNLVVAQHLVAAQTDLRFTFGSLNRTNPDPAQNPPPYDWLIHLDRQLVSQFDLLHVSGYQPYKLTQRFMIDPSNPNLRFLHRAKWFDDDIDPAMENTSYRLYRALEFLSTGSRAAGVAHGGRIPGKININTIWDIETLAALLDEQLPNHFHDQGNPGAFTQRVWQAIQGGIPPVPPRTESPQGIPSGVDLPFWSFATGKYQPGADDQFPDGGGLTASFLRFHGNLGTGHPYQAFEALNKVANQITTRSNVFAVWVTVGFFEVENENVRPVRLGAEIGKAENKHVRHRFFSVVDRTNLSIATDVRRTATAINNPAATPQSVLLTGLNGTFNGQQYNIQVGSTILVDVGERQEAVVVTRITGLNTIEAVFTKPHDQGAPISLPDLPGAPPIFLKSVNVAQVGTTNQYWITVPITRFDTNPNPTLVGEYDGLDWRITGGLLGTRLIVGTGTNQEMVTVNEVRPATGTYQTPHGEFRVLFTKPHPEPLTISNTILGNPGPQPRFNPREAPFSAIVRYLSIIQ